MKHNTNTADAAKQVTDLQVTGNPDIWKLLCKASTKEGDWMKSTKAMEIPGVGIVLQVSSQVGDEIAEALTFIPNANLTIQPSPDKGAHLIANKVNF